MTADPYATGLIGRSAAAYASGVPDDAADDGFFGPASVTWRMSADLALPVAGLRSLLMQALQQTDTPVIAGLLMLIGLFYVVMNLAVDLLHLSIDPRLGSPAAGRAGGGH